ncbi:MAG: hypothetical protein JO359_11955 [Candidatus Eremiobacteraeota bacterium]|nr:hypothetical protein [Candidatus Eremiobacteraeota bacterium]
MRPRVPVARAPASATMPGARRPSTRRPATPPGAQDQTQSMHEAELQLALAAQAARFDAMMKVLAEQQREINAIIDLGMAQAKRDDQLMNEWIRLI